MMALGELAEVGSSIPGQGELDQRGGRRVPRLFRAGSDG